MTIEERAKEYLWTTKTVDVPPFSSIEVRKMLAEFGQQQRNDMREKAVKLVDEWDDLECPTHLMAQEIRDLK